MNLKMTDKTIISKIAGGEIKALDKLYYELKPAFVAFFIGHFSLNADEAQDLYSEAMAALYNNISTERLTAEKLGSNKLSVYVIQVGKYIHLSHLRKCQPEFVTDTDWVMRIGDSLPDDETEARDHDERLFVIRKTVEDMPYPCNKVLNLFYFLQKTHKEVAEIMGYNSPNVSKTQVHRCMDRLRDKVKQRFNMLGL